ncbi:MAG: hypothetical protein IT374_23870 [Polyangiaceae bacterium]|nr:hypothetical protein [Polyangiaceae bacterium]
MTRAARAAMTILALASACDEAPPAAPPKAATPHAPPRADPCLAVDRPAFCGSEPVAASGAGCAYQLSDGVCQGGPDGDTCACVDCAEAARCGGRCVEDGVCDLGGSREDCSCPDCDRAVPACAPPSVGCETDGVCDPRRDDCVCPDCAALAACGACVTNGVCVPYLEGCACADCVGEPGCADAGAP